MKAKPEYIIRKSPHDNLWYVLGLCGKNCYMPISDGYKQKNAATNFAKIQPQIEEDAKKHICDI